MKITIDLPVTRCGDEVCECCGVELSDAEMLINEAEFDYRDFCYDLGEIVLKQLKKNAINYSAN
mgnify:CR=1 FL=1